MVVNKIRTIDTGLFLVILICLITILTVGAILVVGRIDNIQALVESQDTLSILITADDIDHQLISSQLMLININTQSVAMLDLPPYLAAVLKNDNLDRVDRFYNDGNIKEYIAEISELTNMPINHYLRLPGSNLEKIADLIGGIRMFILGETDIIQSIPSGEVVLDGRKVVSYAEHYSNSDDREVAADNLQQLLERLVLTLAEERQHFDDPTVLRYFMRLIDTNLNRQEISSLLDIFYTLDTERYSSWKTQGNLRSVRINDERELLLFPHFGGRWLEETLDQIQTSLAEDPEGVLVGSAVSLRILNGTELSGLARRTKLLFEQYGFEVSRIGDAESNEIERTIIYDHGNNSGAAEKIAEIIQATRIEKQILENVDDQNEVPDVTLVLGSDFDGLYVRN